MFDVKALRSLLAVLVLLAAGCSRAIPPSALEGWTSIPADPINARMRESESVKLGQLLEMLRTAKGPDGKPVEILSTGVHGKPISVEIAGERKEFASYYCGLKLGGSRYRLNFRFNPRHVSDSEVSAFRTTVIDAGGAEVPLRKFFDMLYASNSVDVSDVESLRALRISGYDELTVYSAYQQLVRLAGPAAVQVMRILGEYRMLAEIEGKQIVVSVERSGKDYAYSACSPDTRRCVRDGEPLFAVVR